ncbi:DUF5698 domain-containing protein [Methanoregula sp.]|uniref:DUF2179 domain-containing protein n=1 Tax=Methanoregula sp. TaxID=2052170 RepID=UPI0026370494|nr:DUF5698 domain-containing protein [Methanoregula sp.]MDD5143512.1 DUF5698 domain-containing protein [Methanoregula sp.]
MDLALPLIILLARIIETAMETIRLVYVTKGHKYLASGIGTLKIGIWVLSTGLVLTNLDNIPGIIAYMLGYGIGTLIGMTIESWIGLGTVIVRIFCTKDPEPLIRRLGELGYGTTRINGSGQFVPAVAILISMVPRKEARHLLEVLKTDYPDVHFTIEDVSTMSEREIYFGNRKRGIAGFIGYS